MARLAVYSYLRHNSHVHTCKQTVQTHMHLIQHPDYLSCVHAQGEK